MVTCNECPSKEPRAVKVVLSFGLVALALFCVVCIIVGERMAPRIEAGLGLEPRQSYAPGGFSYDTGKESTLNQIPVNEAAAREVKKQRTDTFFDALNPDLVKTQQASKQPASPKPTGDPVRVTSTPTASRYSVSVFVSTDRASQDLLAWFNSDPALRRLREQCNYQAYTRDNAIYKDRFASLVSPDDFPAVVISDPRGGHVYAAGAAMLPRTANALYEEIYNAFEVHKKVVQQPADDSPVNANVESSAASPDCPDGQCVPDGRAPLLGPDRERLFPLFRPKQPSPAESILYWLWNPGEALLAALCGLAFVLLLLIVAIKVVRG